MFCWHRIKERVKEQRYEIAKGWDITTGSCSVPPPIQKCPIHLTTYPTSVLSDTPSSSSLSSSLANVQPSASMITCQIQALLPQSWCFCWQNILSASRPYLIGLGQKLMKVTAQSCVFLLKHKAYCVQCDCQENVSRLQAFICLPGSKSRWT